MQYTPAGAALGNGVGVVRGVGIRISGGRQSAGVASGRVGFRPALLALFMAVLPFAPPFACVVCLGGGHGGHHTCAELQVL
jgi:hypothetical protein